MAKFKAATIFYKGKPQDIKLVDSATAPCEVHLNGKHIGDAMVIKKKYALAATLDDKWQFRGVTLEEVCTNLAYHVLKGA